MTEQNMPLVIVESPYAADTLNDLADNCAYARACCLDCLKRGEAPFVSHLLYTQPGVLDDDVKAERDLGINAGLAWGCKADLVAVYTDRGTTKGMLLGIEAAKQRNAWIEYRRLG